MTTCKTCGKPYKKDRYNRNDCRDCLRAAARANYHKNASTRNGAVKPEDYMLSWRNRGLSPEAVAMIDADYAAKTSAIRRRLGIK